MPFDKHTVLYHPSGGLPVTALNPLPVTAVVSDIGTIATEVTVASVLTEIQAANVLLTEIEAGQLADGHEVEVNNFPSEYPLPAAQVATLTPPAAITGFATSAKQDTIIGHVDGIETVLGTIDGDTSSLAGCVGGTEMQVDVVSSALPTGAATSANQSGVGYSIARNIDIDESGDNHVATACKLYGWYIHNKNAAVLYLKLYNKASAPTVGTDTPVMTIPIPAGAAANVSFPGGITFATGFGVGATTGVADADTGAPDANDLVGSFLYI